MRTGEFSFRVNKTDGGHQEINVSKAQMEIDAAFEGPSQFFIFEVKNHSATNFNFRQLYYPFRSWSQKISKTTTPVFLTFSNDVFDFYEFNLGDPADFSSGELKRHKRFMLAHTQPAEKDIAELAKESQTEKNRNRSYDQKIPFPQADSLNKVIDMVSILIDSPQSVEDLATHFAFDPRQSDYYYNAAKYLGLATSSKDPETNTELRHATPKAQDIFSKPYAEKYQLLAGEVLKIKPISDFYLRWIKNNQKPSKQDAIELFRDSDDSSGLSLETIQRRAGTIVSWASWIHDIADSD
jgi:hypothetical protein